MVLQPLTCHGWHIHEDNLTIDWDSVENIKAIRERVSLLTKGCKCKTGCTTGRCGCKKKGRQSFVGCMCTNCSNLSNEQQTVHSQKDTAIAEIALEEVVLVERPQLEDTVAEELMDWVFGEVESTETVTDDDSEDISDEEDTCI